MAPYSYSFTVYVNYTRPWRLTYSGQMNVGESNPTNVTGMHTGTGYYSTSVTPSGLDNRMLYLCAQARKLDGSSSTLFLSVNSLYPKNASTPYGSVSFCGRVAP